MELCFDVLRIFCVSLVGLEDSMSAKVASCRFNFPSLFPDKRASLSELHI